MNASRDREYMALAYGLAARAAGRTSPNPCVGAVLVKDGRIVGYGFHEAAGKPHAETIALERAGAAAAGATLYITLEPCVHWGRTPPCIDGVIAAGIARVVVSDRDPNPAVDGRGLARLRRAGIAASVGLMAERNRALNAAYIKRVTTDMPFVTLKAALSLDGRMATRTGEARWITGREARAYAHLVRSEQDAIVIGAGTALNDDPRLGVRLPGRPAKPVLRVVLDGAFRLPPKAGMLADFAAGPVLVIGRAGAGERRRAALDRAGAETMVMGRAGAGARLNLRAVFKRLAERGITAVLVEGGGELATSILELRLADRGLFLFSPRLIGGREAVSVFAGRGAAGLADSLRLRDARLFRLGPDWAVEGVF
ncbi:MAG: bifunctional diaminohydroxyphosphoribosylaminopyrimidine deaminase/5-amino-6-(5-phosphoribosylamino)uracil reductase RibD [Acidobacteriota bacterium]|nr:bifunctional diaminohydroxyphosphoribosylaminopyrimidine deaminase/5-amino-6-(5-phosphoribosylamino)uracil reductase RibD [Acidobacteriota bacterium]